MIRLIQDFGAHTGRQLSFDGPRVRIGRAPGNDVAFDPNVDLDSSGNHCEIVLEDGVYFVADQNSRNGTYVNGNRVQRQRLGHDDVIECGRGGPRLRVDLPHAPPVQLAAPAQRMAAFPATSAVGETEAMPVFRAPSQPGVGPVSFAPSAGPSGFPPPLATPAAPSNFGQALPTPPAPSNFGQALPTPQASPYAPPAPFAPGAFHGTSAPVGAPGFGPPIGSGPQPPQPMNGSLGASVVARLPQGAQVGKRTMAMMIDAALIQAGARKSSTGLKIALAATILLVFAGFGIGGYFMWVEREETDERIAAVGVGDANAGERIARENEAAIYMLASMLPGNPPEGFCTGFAVTPDLIATNAHCVDLAQDLVTTRGRSIVALRNNGRGVQVPLQPLYRDPRFHNATLGRGGSGYDVGLMRALQPLAVRVRLVAMQDALRLTPGANLYVYGFPGMTMNEVSPVATITSGVLSRLTDFFDRAADDPSLAQKMYHSAQTTSGSSGSPIFVATGEVVGVNAGSLTDEEQQNIVDPTTGRRVNVEVNRSSNFKYGMRADLIRMAVQATGETIP